MATAGDQKATEATFTSVPYDVKAADAPRGSGWLLFVGVLLMVDGVLNIFYGIAAISGSKFFAANTHYIFSDLKTWGWITLVLAIIQLAAAASVLRGGVFGRIFGIGVTSLSAIAALLSIPAYPFWSLAVFAIDILIIYGLATYRPGNVGSR